MVHLSIRILEQDVDWQCLATILHVVAWIEYSWVCLPLKCLTSHLHHLTSTKIHPKSKKKNVFLSNNLRFSQKTQQPWHQWCHGTRDHLSLDDAFSVHLGLGVFVQPPKKGGVINKMGKIRKQRLKIFSIVSWGWNWVYQFLQLNHLEGIEILDEKYIQRVLREETNKLIWPSKVWVKGPNGLQAWITWAIGQIGQVARGPLKWWVVSFHCRYH